MSGIAGIIHFDGRPVEPGLIEKMTGAMTDRGPDGINHWVKGCASLGQCMLRTTPESLEEQQPLTNEDESLVLVMDGRVDNWEELRGDLLARGVLLRSRSDAELVLRSYQVWDTGCLQHIDGDFALALWDAGKKEIFCARDRMGSRPIYFWKKEHSIAFSSDFHAILSLPGSPRAVNENMVAEHLNVSVDNLTETLIQGITRLPPAHWQKISQEGRKLCKYWDIDCHHRIIYRDEREYAEHFFHLFSQAVQRRTRSISPVGIYLSGGVDSSAVACVAADGCDEKRTLESYSLIFPGKSCDESRFIEEVNRRCNFKGNFVVAETPSCSHYVEEIVRFKDLCESPNGAMSNRLKLLAQTHGTKVVLTGYGGDEWLGPSAHYYAHLLRSMNISLLLQQFSFERKDGMARGALLNKLIHRGVWPLLPAKVRQLIREVRNRASRSGNEISSSVDLLAPEFAARVASEKWYPGSDRCKAGADPAHRLMHQLLPLGWNVRSKEVENRGLAFFNLEERDPFHDRQVIEFAFAIPENQRSRNTGKHVLRESMYGIMPELIRSRNDKAEFSDVLADTLIYPEVKKWLECRQLVERGYVDGNEVQRRYDEFFKMHNNGTIAFQHIWKLWMVFMVEVWLNALEK